MLEGDFMSKIVFCAVKLDLVVCRRDGFCVVAGRTRAGPVEMSSICPIREKALDRALNCDFDVVEDSKC